MLYAVYYMAPGARPVALTDSINDARKAAVKAAQRTLKLAVGPEDFKWDEYTQEYSVFSRAQATVLGIDFHIAGITADARRWSDLD